MFRVKSELAFTERRMTDIYIYIYENFNVRLASVGLAQARPNYSSNPTSGDNYIHTWT